MNLKKRKKTAFEKLAAPILEAKKNKEIEAYARKKQEIRDLINNKYSEFKSYFSEIVNSLENSSVDITASMPPDLPKRINVHFQRHERECIMHFCNKGSYALVFNKYTDQGILSFGKWDKDRVILWLYQSLFEDNDLPY